MISSRRGFFKNGLLMLGASALGLDMLNTAYPAGVLAETLAQSPQNNNILVIVQMAGGNDGLYAVAPYTDPLLAQNRPTLALSAQDVIPLNSVMGLNKELGALQPLWESGSMAVMQGVGYPDPILSHFQSMYIWESLDMTGQQGSAEYGWLGKYLSTLPNAQSQPLNGIETGNQLPYALQSPNFSVPAIASAANFKLQAPPQTSAAIEQTRTSALLQLYTSFAQANPQNTLSGLLSSVSATTVSATADFDKAYAAYKPAITYPQSTLSSQLQIVAGAITQNLGVKVAYVIIGGFDTHVNAKETLQKLYPELAAAIAAFWQDLHAHGADSNVLMMTWSEFGRRVKENGGMGTDHGTAAPLFVFGPKVKGGLYGSNPDLSSLDTNGNLVYTTDFRSVYATVLTKWAQANTTSLLGGTYPLLNFL